MKLSNIFRMSALLVAASSIFVSGAAYAAVPKLLTYQGVLKDGSGNFLTGTYSMVFRIYSASSGGSALWTETQSSVSASAGKFSVQLGSVTTLSLDFNADYWLSIQVGADAEMSPRIRLTSMGYGIRADYDNNGFTQTQHDALSHVNIEGVRENTVNLAKTNFKLDAYTLASANNLGDLIVDTFTDAAGIHSGSSSNYTWRGSSDYDVVLASGGIDVFSHLVLHGNGSDASTTFTDSSSGTKTVSGYGNAQIDTAQSKFGGASVLLDGTGDYLSVPDSNDWNFGTGSFTIDAWVRFSSTGSQYVWMQGSSSTDFAYIRWTGSGWDFAVFVSNTDLLSAAMQGMSDSVSTGTWYHIAVVRNGNAWAFYRDGVSKGSTTASITYPNYTNAIGIGSNFYDGTNHGSNFNGWIDEFRVSKGLARWTAGFTPPTAEYAVASGSATVISNAYSVPAAPASALVVADETLGGGSIVYSVSRDNGTTWTTCTKETVTSISSQPSGAQVKWKAVITGDAELNAVAVAV